MATYNRYVLTDGESFISKEGLTFNINYAILFTSKPSLSMNDEFNFKEVELISHNEFSTKPDRGFKEHYIAISPKGEFVELGENSRRYTNHINDATLFTYCPDESKQLELLTDLSNKYGTVFFLIQVYSRRKRSVKLVDDHVQPVAAKQCDSRTLAPSVNDAIVNRGGVKITIKGATGTAKDYFMNAILQTAQDLKLDSNIANDRFRIEEKPTESVYIGVTEKEWRDE